MDYFLFYVVGCVVNIFALLVHFAFGYFTLGAYTVSNNKKIGIHVSYLGGFSTQPKPIGQIIFDVLLSWIAVAVNIVTLFSRIVHYIKTISSPPDIKKINHSIAHYDLTVEEIIVLQLKSRSSIAGMKFTTEEIDELLNDGRWINIHINRTKLIDLITSNDLLKKAS